MIGTGPSLVNSCRVPSRAARVLKTVLSLLRRLDPWMCLPGSADNEHYVKLADKDAAAQPLPAARIHTVEELARWSRTKRLTQQAVDMVAVDRC
jgi:hypothetical protein